MPICRERRALTLDRIVALRRQEDGPYRRVDYMPRRGMGMGMGMGMGSDGDGDEEEKDLSSSFSSQTSLSSLASSSTASSTASSSVPVDEECREIMLLWFYSVLDHCRFARENGAAATYLLDLYLATPEGRSVDLLDRSAFQLASMTALFLALKMNEGETVTADMVARLSRGGFRAHDVARQEWRMLRALGFRVHPPTPLTFCRHYVELLGQGGWSSGGGGSGSGRKREASHGHEEEEEEEEPPPPDPALRALLRTAEAQVELSVLERSFLEVPPSVVAYAALLNAATCLARTAEERPSPFLLADFGTALELGGLVALPSGGDGDLLLRDVRGRLLALVGGGTEPPSSSSRSSSPVAVVPREREQQGRRKEEDLLAPSSSDAHSHAHAARPPPPPPGSPSSAMEGGTWAGAGAGGTTKAELGRSSAGGSPTGPVIFS